MANVVLSEIIYNAVVVAKRPQTAFEGQQVLWVVPHFISLLTRPLGFAVLPTSDCRKRHLNFFARYYVCDRQQSDTREPHILSFVDSTDVMKRRLTVGQV
jgi:hypothetical protein